MSKYQVYLYFALTAIGTAAVFAVLWNLLLPTEKMRRQHARKTWTVVLFFSGLIVIAAGFFVYWITEQYKNPAAIVQGIGVGLIMVVILAGTYEASDLFRGQGLFFGSVSVIASVAVVGLIAAVNFYTYQNPMKYDFNQDKLESLNDETVKVLKALQKPIEVIAFLYKQEKQQEQGFRGFFEKYSTINQKKFFIRVINPVDNPKMAECFGVKGEFGSQLRNRVVLTIKGKCVQKNKRTVFNNKKIVIEKLSEQEITNKLIRLTRLRQKTVCFLRGRGQPSIESKNRYGYSEFKKQLTEKGFKTREVNLLTSEKVPSGCDLVVQAVPEWVMVMRQGGEVALKSAARLSKVEVDRVERYLNAGGKMLVFQEPLVSSGLEGLLKKNYGIEWRPGAVVDFLVNFKSDPRMPMGTDFSASHPIVKGFFRRARMPFQWTAALKRSKNVPSGVTVTDLVKTTKVRLGIRGRRGGASCCSFYIPTPLSRGFIKIMQNSRRWRRNEMLRQIAVNRIIQKTIPGSEVGAHTLAMTALKKGAKVGKQTRIVVFADSALASNFMMQVPIIRTVIFNSVAWLAKEKDLVHIVTKRRKPSNINLSSTQKKMLRLTTRYGVPLLFFFIILMVVGIRRQK